MFSTRGLFHLLGSCHMLCAFHHVFFSLVLCPLRVCLGVCLLVPDAILGVAQAGIDGRSGGLGPHACVRKREFCSIAVQYRRKHASLLNFLHSVALYFTVVVAISCLFLVLASIGGAIFSLFYCFFLFFPLILFSFLFLLVLLPFSSKLLLPLRRCLASDGSLSLHRNY